MTTHNVHYTDYMVLEAENPAELTGAVMKAIQNRWQPYGDLVALNTQVGSENPVRLLQPMVQQSEWYR